MYNVAVLMSTYNGEKYLSEQIDSILAQKDVNIDLYIRDDGSSDKTIDIISSYKSKYSNITLFKEKNIGVGNSFMELLYKVPNTYDYYAISDQDDIWLDNKILSAINILNHSNYKLYASNQTLIDKFNNYLRIRYTDTENVHLKPIEILFSNKLAGCTMVFNNDFFRLLTDKKNRPSKKILNIRIHDVWFAMVGSLYDYIIYDKSSYILYRQHDSNVVGAYNQGFFKNLSTKFNKIIDKSQKNGRSKLASEIYKLFPDKIDNKSLIYYSSRYNLFSSKIHLLLNIKYLASINNENIFALIFKIIFNFY